MAFLAMVMRLQSVLQLELLVSFDAQKSSFVALEQDELPHILLFKPSPLLPPGGFQDILLDKSRTIKASGATEEKVASSAAKTFMDTIKLRITIKITKNFILNILSSSPKTE